MTTRRRCAAKLLHACPDVGEFGAGLRLVVVDDAFFFVAGEDFRDLLVPFH